MKRKIKPKLVPKNKPLNGSEKLKDEILDAAEKLRVLDQIIPSTYEETKKNQEWLPNTLKAIEDENFIKQPLFSGSFVDNIAALCFVGGFTCLGVVIGLSLK